jgi:hypothetical protein
LSTGRLGAFGLTACAALLWLTRAIWPLHGFVGMLYLVLAITGPAILVIVIGLSVRSRPTTRRPAAVEDRSQPDVVEAEVDGEIDLGALTPDGDGAVARSLATSFIAGRGLDAHVSVVPDAPGLQLRVLLAGRASPSLPGEIELHLHEKGIEATVVIPSRDAGRITDQSA